jgi:UDP-N-acetylmuramate dehydrogenase
MEIQEQALLSPLTTFKIGGPARFFIQATSVEEVRDALAFAKEKGLNVFILGGGSNVLFDDAGFDGLVIKIEVLGVEQKKNIFVAGAGESWDALAARAVQSSLWGIENLSGIPGTVGGAAVQNIGAYGAALSQTLLWVEALDTQSGEIQKIARAEYEPGYRQSVFKKHDGRYVVLRAALSLSPEPAPDLSYKDMAARFAGAVPSLPEIREAVLQIRAGKFPDLSVEGTAGSFFLNPVVSEAQALALQKLFPLMPLFKMPETSDIKVPLGWLLDYRHGVIDLRDVRAGGARMFEKQFLVLVAERNASSADIKMVAALVQKKVRDAIGIEIVPEVRIV